MIIEPMKTEGGWICSDFIGNEYIKMRYIGYTKKEARQLFKEYLKELNQ